MPPQGKAKFTSKLFVYAIDPKKSIKTCPITIQGIGGDGRMRNCTILVNYKSPIDLVDYGINLRKWGHWNESIGEFEKAIKIDPRLASAHYNLGKSLGMGNYSNALLEFNKAIEIDPQYEDAWLEKGCTLTTSGNLNEAIKAFEKVIEINSTNANAWYNKGLLLYKIGDFNESIQAFEKVIQLNPKVGSFGSCECRVSGSIGSVFNDEASALDALGRTNESLFLHRKARILGIQLLTPCL
jgi:tetratricopeptide (TPR) repeat protein